MDEIKAKQQVVEKIKEAGKILVTVSDDPSVDALSAALALTMILDKQEKYATAIFSGQTPPAIAFLEPEKTFDDTTDSLHDFIIALNKEKADHLRYKVEGDSVKIFITPYKTTINQDDLVFSQGDYNVELVIALGVDKQANLDGALENHGQILHDAAIITMTAGDQTSDLGGIDWHDSNSSSLSEMVAGLAEALKEDKKKPLLDTPIATALLTGIVAETDRFSNEHTTSKVMTVAASLMAAGADQQLIATELQNAREAEQPHDDSQDESGDSAGDTSDSASEDTSPETNNDGELDIKKDTSTLDIEHDDETLAELDKRVLGEEKAKEKVEEELEAIEEEAEEAAEEHEQEVIEESKPQIDEPEAKEPEPTQADSSDDAPHASYAPADDEVQEPTFGGALSATAEEAADDARRAEEEDQNKTILSHAYIGDQPPVVSAADGLTGAPVGFPGTPSVAPGSVGVNDVDEAPATPQAAYAFDAPAHTADSSATGISGERVIQPLDQPAPQPAAAPTPADLGLPLPPPLPDFSQGVTPPPAIPLPPSPAQPGILGDILAPEPAQPEQSSALPPFETSNAVAAPGSAYAFEPEIPALPPQQAPAPEAPQTPPASTPPTNPGQFQIPGQQ